MTALLANDGCYEGLQLLKASTVELMEQRCEPQLPDGSWQALSLRSQDGLYGRDRLGPGRHWRQAGSGRSRRGSAGPG